MNAYSQRLLDLISNMLHSYDASTDDYMLLHNHVKEMVELARRPHSNEHVEASLQDIFKYNNWPSKRKQMLYEHFKLELKQWY